MVSLKVPFIIFTSLGSLGSLGGGGFLVLHILLRSVLCILPITAVYKYCIHVLSLYLLGPPSPPLSLDPDP